MSSPRRDPNAPAPHAPDGMDLTDGAPAAAAPEGVPSAPDEGGTRAAVPLPARLGVQAAPAAPQYVLQMSVIFNDPRMYALRLALDGPAAKVFKGLDFQIMYRRVTDTVGVYQAEIRLPDAMRELSIGAYSITLPVFGIAVYTNGDFRVDVGFPWNQDFSRSFTIQGIVYPGIPLIGSAGFYFGKLSSASSTQVPKADNGTFNPVLVFGLGMQFGVGKWIEKGVLRAGFSITVVGIIEGVLAKWNPYSLVPAGGGKNQLQGEYYFWLQGTVGIIGRLFGSVDFAVIKASVDVTVKLLAQITYESYADIAFTVIASVDISLSVEIDLGLFSISIDLSFRARIKESFVIRNSGTPPWQVTGGARSAVAQKQAGRLRAATAPATLSLAARTLAEGLQWENLQPLPEEEKVRLEGWMAPALTAAGEEGAAPGAAYVTVLSLASVPTAGGTAAALRSAGEAGDTSFELLCNQVLLWAVAAATGPATPAEAAARIVSDDTLLSILDRLAGREVPIDPADADRFMDGQFRVSLTVPAGTGRRDATLFPVPPALELEVPAYGGMPKRQYTFAGFNSLSSGYLGFLREYFDKLAVQVAPRSPAPRAGALRETSAGPSMATYVFGDYFTLLARQMVQSARDALRSLQVPVRAGDTPDGVVRWVNQNGAVHAVVDGVPATVPFTRAGLFEGNPAQPLTAGKTLRVAGVTQAVRPGDTLNAVAAAFQDAFTAAALAERNADTAGLLAPGAAIRVPGKPERTVSPGDTFGTLAQAFGLTVAELVAQAGLAAQEGLLTPFAVMHIPELAHAVAEGDTLGSVAQRYAVTLDDLAAPAANGTVAGLFTTSADHPFLSVPHLAEFRVSELLAEIQRTLGLRQLAGMASRYLLAGLRLPTEGITQNAPCACGGDTTALPPECGLYALTGQQFTLPPLAADPAFTFTVRKPGAGLDWVWMNGAAASRELTVTAGADEVARANAVREAAAAGLVPDTRSLGVMPMYAVGEASWPLSPTTAWQSAGRADLPYGTPPARETLRLWGFPAELTDLPDATLHDALPRFALKVGRYDESTGTLVRADAGSYAWATRVSFGIKRVPVVPGSPTTAYTYEVMGAGEADTVLLERLLAAMPSGTGAAVVDDLVLLFPSDPARGAAVGLESADAANLAFFLAQVNLSTETRPSGALAQAAGLRVRTVARTRACWNTPRDFVRLLWEASVTRAGGFYLYYHDEAGKAGLPERIFNDRGEAVLTLLVTYLPQPDAPNRLAPYMNCAATADGLDPTRDSVFAQASPEAATRSLAPKQTPAQLARRSYMDPLQLLTDNAGLVLAQGAVVRVEGAVYEVRTTAPGNRLSQIAPYFEVDPEEVKKLNPGVADWEAIPLFTAIRLPGVDAVAGSDTTLAGLAAFYGARLGDLAAANQDRDGLYDRPLWVRGGPSLRSTTVPPGTVMLQATRGIPAVPARPEPGNGWGGLYLQKLYAQLGWRVWGDPARNTDFDASGAGLPAGPATPVDEAQAAQRVGLPAAPAAGGTWTYQQAVPAYRYVRDGLPPGTERSPYAAVGRILQVDFAWQDLYGNRVRTPLQDPSLAPASPLNRPPLVVGYTDALVAPGQWPSVAPAWHVEEREGTPALVVELQFDRTRYEGADARANAVQDLRIYDRLLPQIAEGAPAPVTWALETSLLPGAPVALDAAAVRTWVQGIRDWLAERAGQGSGAAVPVAKAFTAPLAADKLNSAQLFEIRVQLVMARPRPLADADFRDTEGVWRAASGVPPRVERQGGTDTTQGAYTLAQLAEAFEKALRTPEWTLKLAAGVDRARVARAGAGAPLWAVRLGTAPGQGIRFEVTDAGNPVMYAPRPLSNELRSRPQVPIWSYETGTPIDFDANPSTHLDFGGVDLDTWGRALVTGVDGVLAPEFTSPVVILGRRDGQDYQKELLDQKERLADALHDLLIPVLQDQDPDAASLGEAREVFRQQLLVRLASAYATSAVVQFRAAVTASVPQPPGSETPRFFGQPVSALGSGELPTGVSLTAARLALRNTTEDDPARLTFVLSAGGGNGGPDESATDRVLPLTLRYRATHLEQEISAVPGVGGGYRASSWLAFVLPPQGSTLEADLGSFDVPLVLRAFPTPPSLTEQAGTASPAPGGDADVRLEDVVRWDYAFTYREDYHYAQDQTHLRILFNVADGRFKGLAVGPDLFETLAEFATVGPEVQSDLQAWLARIGPDTSDETVFANARAALVSFIRMVRRVADSWTEGPGLRGARVGSAMSVAERRLVVQELGQAVEGEPDRLRVVVREVAPAEGVAQAEGGDPAVRIAGWEMVPADAQAEPGTWAYEYRRPGDRPGKWEYLTPHDGRALPDRTVTIPGLDILGMQDAWSSAWIVRNRDLVPGRPTREAFVYTTSEIRFASVLHPTLDVVEPIFLQRLGGDGTPRHRPLALHLEALLQTLFASAAGADQTLQLECRWAFPVRGGVDPVSLPVLFVPPTPFEASQFAVPAGGCPEDGDTTSLPCNLAGAIGAWARANQPVQEGAELRFDLTVMSGLTQRPMPMLRLRSLVLPLAWVTPPPG